MLACSVKSFILLPKWVGKCVKNILVMEPVIGPLAIRPKGGSLQCPDTSKVFVSKKQSLKCWFWIFLGVEWQQTLKKKKRKWGDEQREKTATNRETPLHSLKWSGQNQRLSRRAKVPHQATIIPHLWPMNRLLPWPSSPGGSNFHPLLLSSLRKHK